MPTVIIPTPLRKFTNNTAKLVIKAATIDETVNELTVNFPDLKKHLLDDTGQIRSFVNIFVGDDDIRNLQQGSTVVKEDTVISIVPAIAGGGETRKVQDTSNKAQEMAVLAGSLASQE